MPPKSPNTVHILEGKATLYRRPTTPHWHVRYKADGRWQRCTTKCDELDKAKDKAVDIVMNAWFRERNNLPAVTKRFKSVANLAIKRMEDALAAGAGKVVFKDYIQATNNYLIPFFGNHNIDKIDYALVQQFTKWREEQFKRVPSASTINTHNSALNRVFDEALERGFMTRTQIPTLRNDGRTGNRRPDFTDEEYLELIKHMRRWIKKARKGNEQAMRYLLRDYVLILVNTGIRAGTEAMNLQWKHFRFHKQDDKLFLVASVKGKAKKVRDVTIRYNAISYFHRIQKRNPKLADMSFVELIKAGSDEYVFGDGRKDMQTALGRIFKRLLTAADLLVDRRTGNERTLYSLRHVFATRTLTKTQLTTHFVAQHMGTGEDMIRKYYSHVDLMKKAADFAGAGSIDEALGLAARKSADKQ